MPKVVITGGTGLVGSHLYHKLIERNYEVVILVRDEEEKSRIATPSFVWDYETKTLEEGALEGCDYLIHLAGAPISNRWKDDYKKRILASRVDSAQFLLEQCRLKDIQLSAFISASATGYYGAITSDKIFTEEDTPGDDFLAQVCKAWEAKALDFKTQAKRVVMLRTSGVLAKEAGMLPELKEPIEKNVGSPLGSGKQYVPWIHVDDLCEMYIYAMENEAVNGAYNAAAPEHITNKQFVKKLARLYGKRIWFPKVPIFMLKLLFGEMAGVILKGSRVSSEKIRATGFKFKFEILENALKDLK